MTKPGIKIEGERELRKALRAVESGIDGLREVHRDAAELVGAEAARLVPVRSGKLQATIRAAGQAAGAVVRAGYASVPYAGPIHFGWAKRNIAPQPFLYDALDRRHDEVIETYQRQLDELVKRHGLD